MNQDLQIVPSDSHIIISNLVTNPRLKIKQFQEEFFPFSIGVDGFFNKLSSSSLQTTSNVFPPYNIVKEGNKSYIAVALAGYKKSNIEVSVDDGVLLIKGKKGLQETLDGEGEKFKLDTLIEVLLTEILLENLVWVNTLKSIQQNLQTVCL